MLRPPEEAATGLELDHVLIAVDDLDGAGRWIESRHGLTSIEGGRHAGWGTANRIVPLGGSYLELIAAVDQEEAARSGVGRWVLGRRAVPGRPLGWVVRTGKLDAVARRLGLVIGSGSRTDREGRPVSWRMTGLERSAAESSHPFFIEWGSSTAHPGDAAAGDSAGRMRIARLDLRGDQDSLSAWLGHARNLPFAVRPGAPEVERIWLEGPDRGEFALDLA